MPCGAGSIAISSAADQHVLKETDMQKILIPCDGSENGLRVLRYAASLAIKLSDVQLELLNVQEPLPQKVHAALSEQEIARWQAGESDIILEAARQILDAEEVQYKVRSRVGSPANEIALHVHETQCDAIIMGTRGRSPIVNLVIGSVATKVIYLVQVPVTLIK
jgi:nucleotide-binding universal stress UspA family protein